MHTILSVESPYVKYTVYLFKASSLLLCFLCIGACSQTSTFDAADRMSLSPETWHATQAKNVSHSDDKDTDIYWPLQYGGSEIFEFSQQAISNNIALRQTILDVKIQQKQLTIAQASLLPTLSLDIASSRRQTDTGLTSNSNIELSASYEIDIWGKLSAQEQSQAYEYLAAKAAVEEQIQTLIALVYTSYANAIEAQELEALFGQKSSNSAQGLKIIEDGYKQGLNSALDVYLARNELNSDLAREAQQRAVKIATIRIFEDLLSIYPSGKLALKEGIPHIQNTLNVGIPASMVLSKPSLRVSWLNLLASDANLAFVHKQRFPTFRLTASMGSSEDNVKDLFSGDLIWSLLGSVISPIYNAGSLKANEDIARLTFQQTELIYLDELNNAFANVENGLSQEDSLTQQQALLTNAAENAVAAEALSFEQYLKGLVTYTTVLEAQARAVDAQSALIQVKRELFTNRIGIHVALGNNFGPNSTTSEIINDTQ